MAFIELFHIKRLKSISIVQLWLQQVRNSLSLPLSLSFIYIYIYIYIYMCVCVCIIYWESNRGFNNIAGFPGVSRTPWIVIIMPCRQLGYPWLSLTTPPYRSSFLPGLQGYILYPHRADVGRFELVALL